MGIGETEFRFFLGEMNKSTVCLNGWKYSGALAKECQVPWKIGLIWGLSPGNRIVGSPCDHSWQKINCIGGRDPSKMDYETSVHPKYYGTTGIGLVGPQRITFENCSLLPTLS